MYIYIKCCNSFYCMSLTYEIAQRSRHIQTGHTTSACFKAIKEQEVTLHRLFSDNNFNDTLLYKSYFFINWRQTSLPNILLVTPLVRVSPTQHNHHLVPRQNSALMEYTGWVVLVTQ